ncbi:MAG TPA: hypothetical protein VNT54_10375 [Solirubrobacteraceae bacterium]|nr:hypothetical protein [Solirubrobacteraceae bacterium]
MRGVADRLDRLQSPAAGAYKGRLPLVGEGALALGEPHDVLFERLVRLGNELGDRCVCRWLRRAAGGGQHADDLIADLVAIRAEFQQDPRTDPVLLAHESKQDVLGPDVVVLEHAHLFLCADDDLTRLLCESLERGLPRTHEHVDSIHVAQLKVKSGGRTATTVAVQRAKMGR